MTEKLSDIPELMEAKVVVWFCPEGHSHRPHNEPIRETVRWVKDVAHCMIHPCHLTSLDTIEQNDITASWKITHGRDCPLCAPLMNRSAAQIKRRDDLITMAMKNPAVIVDQLIRLRVEVATEHLRDYLDADPWVHEYLRVFEPDLIRRLHKALDGG